MNNSSDCIESFYSDDDQNILLHQLFSPKNKKGIQRINISPANESIQVSHLSLENNQTFRAHKHVFYKRDMPMAQESWVVISGKVEIYYYDLSDNLIATRIMSEGDCTITYRGGHNYKCIEENTIVYEFKTGPYHGVEKDKVFIN